MLPQKRIFIFKTFDYHYTFSSSFKWKVKRNFLARWKTSVAAERQKYLLITYFKKVAKNSLVLNINSLVQPHHCNPHPEKCPIILKKLWLHDMTNKDTITTTKPPRKPLVVAFWACFLQKKINNKFGVIPCSLLQDISYIRTRCIVYNLIWQVELIRFQVHECLVFVAWTSKFHTGILKHNIQISETDIRQLIYKEHNSQTWRFLSSTLLNKLVKFLPECARNKLIYDKLLWNLSLLQWHMYWLHNYS